MAEDTQGQQNVATPTSVLTEPAPAPSAPAVTTPTPPAAGGPSLETMFSKLQELERSNAELAERAARAEHEANYTRNLVDTFRQGAMEQKETAPQVPDITDDEFLQNPGKAIDKKISALFEREKAEREREKQVAYVERAKNLFETGSKTAADKLGKLMSGIEPEVKQYVQQGIISGSIDPEAAQNPDLWAATAITLRYIKGERSLDKYFGETRVGMAPTYTETPTAGSPPQVTVALTDAEKATARYFGVTDEQYLAAKKKGEVK